MSRDDNYKIKVDTRDRLLRAWEISQELGKDFEQYSKQTQDDERVSQLFAKFAEDEELHAAKLCQILHEYQTNQSIH
ncbi:rubrerythrin [Aminipila sp.]|uniref:rubrerythrin n=1 Tax=Aminipila sp. TaxID=2060095 RepID=UPI00289C10E6|nr:rubrerythrin [Aminipila sp.]